MYRDFSLQSLFASVVRMAIVAAFLDSLVQEALAEEAGPTASATLTQSPGEDGPRLIHVDAEEYAEETAAPASEGPAVFLGSSLAGSVMGRMNLDWGRSSLGDPVLFKTPAYSGSRRGVRRPGMGSMRGGGARGFRAGKSAAAISSLDGGPLTTRLVIETTGPAGAGSPATTVPEPTTWAIWAAAGAIGLAALRRTPNRSAR